MLAFDSLLFRTLATLSLIIAIVAALYLAKAVFLPVALALLIALILHLPLNAFQRAHIPRVLSVVLLIAGVAAFLLILVVLMAQPVRQVAETYPQILGELRSKLLSLRESMAAAEQASDAISQVAEDVKEIVEEPGVQEVVVREPNFLTRAATSVADIATGMVITLTLAGFILATRRPFLTITTMPFARRSAKIHAARVWQSVEREISHYFLVTSIINACLGLAVGTVLWLLGVASPHLWGIAVALLNYILFVGPTMGTLTLLAASIIQFDTALQALAPPAAYLAINFIEANFITPHFLGRRLNIAPMAILISLLFWGWLWGFAGLIIAVPVLVILKAVADKTASLSVICRLLTPRSARSATADVELTERSRIQVAERSST